MRNLTVKKWIALILKIALAAVIAVFLGSESLNFFEYVFPPDQWYLAYTGLGLTMGAAFVYLYLLLNDADTPLQRTIALIMTIVGVVGELASAGFGMQIEAWKKSGWVLTESDFDFMILVIRIMMLVHGIALLLYWTGDRVFEILEEQTGKDINNDGKIGKNTRSNNQQQSAPVSRPEAPRAMQQQQGTQYTLPAFLNASGMKTEQAFGDFLDETETFGKAWQVLRDRESANGYTLPSGISHKNFNELAGKVNGRVKDF